MNMPNTLHKTDQSPLGLLRSRDNSALGQVRHALFLLALMSLPTMAQTSFWTGTATPQVAAVRRDSRSVTLGLKFYSGTAGDFSGARVFKGPQKTREHVGTPWSR